MPSRYHRREKKRKGGNVVTYLSYVSQTQLKQEIYKLIQISWFGGLVLKSDNSPLKRPASKFPKLVQK